MNIRVRFAPSPTGYLHIGGARTALFNWLLARGSGGKFILRIEDTDLVRSTEESVNVILRDLKWLGMEWDEGPFKQSERLTRYKEVADSLAEKGLLYECFCTPDELDARRKEAMKNKMPPRYDRRCFGLSDGEKEAQRAEGRNPALRYKVADEGEVIIEDIVRGSVKFLNKDIGDLIFVRADGMPTYNFVVAVDDHDMGITHVVRGEDHLSNTPKQIYIYEAMGWELPKFAHLSMILGGDRVPLSKRHASVAVEDFRKRGFLAEAMVNFLALMGWSYDDQSTIFSVDELIQKFSLERVNKSGAIFDFQKLLWINGEHIRLTSTEDLTDLALPFVQDAGLVGSDLSDEDLAHLREIVALCRDRVNLLSEIPGFIAYFYEDPEPAVAELLQKVPIEKVPIIVRDCLAMFGRCDELTQESIENVVAAIADNLGVKPAWIYQTLRIFITGKMVTPPLNPSMLILGRDTVIRRLEAAHRSLGV